jgi:vacuolar-type H+-ATPase subunit I/STV1
LISFITFFFFVAGAALLIFGYKKNKRALLTIAAFLWLASGALGDFAHGFSDGLKSSGAAVAISAGR